MKKDNNIREYLKEIGFMFVFFIFVLVLTIGGAKMYCEFNPAYELDHVCHSPELRCEIECGRYDLNFTGETKGCSCLCSDGSEVSVCSGFRYEDD